MPNPSENDREESVSCPFQKTLFCPMCTSTCMRPGPTPDDLSVSSINIGTLNVHELF